MNKCDWCKNDSVCSAARRRECIVRDNFWFEMETSSTDDENAIVRLLVSAGVSRPQKVAEYLVNNGVVMKTI